MGKAKIPWVPIPDQEGFSSAQVRFVNGQLQVMLNGKRASHDVAGRWLAMEHAMSIARESAIMRGFGQHNRKRIV